MSGKMFQVSDLKLASTFLLLTIALILHGCLDSGKVKTEQNFPAGYLNVRTFDLIAAGKYLNGSSGMTYDALRSHFLISCGTSMLHAFQESTDSFILKDSFKLAWPSAETEYETTAILALTYLNSQDRLTVRAIRTAPSASPFLSSTGIPSTSAGQFLISFRAGDLSFIETSPPLISLSYGKSLATDGTFIYDCFYDGAGTTAIRKMNFQGTELERYRIKGTFRLVACAFENAGKFWFVDEETPGSGVFGYFNPLSPDENGYFIAEDTFELPIGVRNVQAAIWLNGFLYLLTPDARIHRVSRP